MRNRITEFLNRHGLFTLKQHTEVLDERAALEEYAHHLERAINGMADPAKPIIVIGDYTRVHDVCLQHGQQIIVSPYATGADVRNVLAMSPERSTQAAKGDGQ